MKMKKFWVFSIICIITLVTFNNPLTNGYISTLNRPGVMVANTRASLLEEVEKYAAKADIKASNARIDPVWKAIPGYNGLVVDVASSYKNMKKRGSFDRGKLVFKQLKPTVHLDDLPPAPIYKGHPDKPMVSFIINVAWGNEYLPQMLAVLKKHNVSVSFFLEGNWVKENPEMAKLIADAGHELGNHSYSHPDMKKLSTIRTREEIMKTNEVIEATTDKACVWFAPPSGSYRDETIKIAAEQKLKTVLWSVDTIDWQKPSPEKLMSRVMGKIHNGAMVLMHPTEATARSLDTLISQIESKGLEIGTVTELMDEKRIMKKNLPFGE